MYKRQRTKFTEFESLYFSVCTISSLLFFNIYTIEILLEKLHIIPKLTLSITEIILFIIFLIISNFLLFFLGKRYKKIVTVFDNKMVVFGLGWILIYVAVSIVSFFYVVNI
jgi:hypothetical protein